MWKCIRACQLWPHSICMLDARMGQVAGEHKMVAVDDAADCGQLLRLLGETQAGVPLWRRQRPCVLADAAHFYADAAEQGVGTLAVRQGCAADHCL